MFLHSFSLDGDWHAMIYVMVRIHIISFRYSLWSSYLVITLSKQDKDLFLYKPRYKFDTPLLRKTIRTYAVKRELSAGISLLNKIFDVIFGGMYIVVRSLKTHLAIFFNSTSPPGIPSSLVSPWWVITSILKYGMKLLIHSQTSTV